MSLAVTVTTNIRRGIILSSSVLCLYVSLDMLRHIGGDKTVGATLVFILMFSVGAGFFRYLLDSYNKLSITNTEIRIRELFKTHTINQQELLKVTSISDDSLFIETEDEIFHLYYFSNSTSRIR